MSYHHGDLREALLKEARKFVEEFGDNALSLRACARAIGVDIAATYRHFRAKDEVLAAVAAQGFDELGRKMQKAMVRVGRDICNAEKYFLVCGKAYVDFALEHPKLYRLMFGGRCSSESIMAQHFSHGINEEQHRPYVLLSEALDLLIEASLIPNVLRPNAEFLVWSSVHGMVSLLIDGRGKLSADESDKLIEQSCRMLVMGLAGVQE